MRIVAVADTHLFHEELVIPDGDVFIHAGDLCRGGDLAELERAASWITALPHRHKVVVAGNHDWAFITNRPRARALFAGVTYLEDEEAILDGVHFYGSPWQPAFHDWAFNLPRGPELAAKWSRIPTGLDVLVTHSPPAGLGDRSPVGSRTGCADLRARITEVEPRLHLFGHIHQDGGAWREGATQFVNVTTWECERAPTVIDLARELTLVTVPPSGRDNWPDD